MSLAGCSRCGTMIMVGLYEPLVPSEEVAPITNMLLPAALPEEFFKMLPVLLHTAWNAALTYGGAIVGGDPFAGTLACADGGHALLELPGGAPGAGDILPHVRGAGCGRRTPDWSHDKRGPPDRRSPP